MVFLNRLREHDDIVLLDPLAITESKWIYHWRPEQVEVWGGYYNSIDHGGTWILHYDIGNVQDAWCKAVKLYEYNELIGIDMLKVCTASSTEKVHKTKKSLLFTCGPACDKNRILAYGRNLVEKMDYRFGSQRSHVATKIFFQQSTMTNGEAFEANHKRNMLSVNVLDAPPDLENVLQNIRSSQAENIILRPSRPWAHPIITNVG